MNAIGNPADAKIFAISIAHDRGETGVKRGTDFTDENRRAVFGAENNVDEETRERLRHDRLSRLGI